MAGISYSPEQTTFFNIKGRHGIFFNQANAGSGKTECSSELFVRVYIEEEKRMFPHIAAKAAQGITMHVSGDDQRKILRQFIVITFTVKAAEELNTRIKAKFVTSGIPEPLSAGGYPIKICRTIDSLLQTWFRNRTFFQAWNDWEFEDRKKSQETETKRPRLNLSHYFLMKAFQQGGGEADIKNSYDFFHAWPTLLIGDVMDAVMAAIIRNQFKVKLEGIENPFNWRDMIQQSAQESTLNGRSISCPFFDDIVDNLKKRKEHESKVRLRVTKAVSGNGSLDDIRFADQYKPLIDLWDRIEMAIGEFQMVYGIAKTRFYDPYLSPENINNNEVLAALAQNQVINSALMFHSLAKKYAQAKAALGVMDYSDFMDIFLRTVKQRPEIMDLRNEYPKYGIRAKNLIIDETQDNSPAQYEIMRAMLPLKGIPFRSVAVGDVKQSIYGFRGASPKHFICAVERYRKSRPDHVFSLSCSFRSCRKIVDLGNEIVTTLPSYRDTVVKSSTIYDEDGEVEISPPLKNEEDESRFVLKEIGLIQKRDPGASIMILVRQSIFSHPLFKVLDGMEHPPATMLTMHRSKGLEADYVFVMGMTSGSFPDVRGDWDQETNLLYVAATRARRKVTFTVPIYSTVILEDGHKEIREAGPSPFFRLVPSLEKAAIAKGWDHGLLMEGYLYHQREKDRFQSTMATKMASLRDVVEASFPEPTYREVDDMPLELPTNAPASGTLSFMKRRRKAPPKGKLLPDGSIGIDKTGHFDWNEDSDAKLKAKLIKAFSLNMQIPKMKGDQLGRAIQLGWIGHDGRGGKVFTPDFKNLLRS